jgi:hypothetical protein
MAGASGTNHHGFRYGSHTRVLHWHGSSWSHVASPNRSLLYFNELCGVDTYSATDGLGSRCYMPDPPACATLALHWDGTSWAQVATPNPPGSFNCNYLDAVSVASAADAWTVGYAESKSLILHWDGSAWTRVTSPSTDSTYDKLYGVSAVSAADVWAVGTSTNSTTRVTDLLVLQ